MCMAQDICLDRTCVFASVGQKISQIICSLLLIVHLVWSHLVLSQWHCRILVMQEVQMMMLLRTQIHFIVFSVRNFGIQPLSQALVGKKRSHSVPPTRSSPYKPEKGTAAELRERHGHLRGSRPKPAVDAEEPVLAIEEPMAAASAPPKRSFDRNYHTQRQCLS